MFLQLLGGMRGVCLCCLIHNRAAEATQGFLFNIQPVDYGTEFRERENKGKFKVLGCNKPNQMWKITLFKVSQGIKTQKWEQ